MVPPPPPPLSLRLPPSLCFVEEADDAAAIIFCACLGPRCCQGEISLDTLVLTMGWCCRHGHHAEGSGGDNDTCTKRANFFVK